MLVTAIASMPTPTDRAAIRSTGSREVSAADSRMGMRRIDENIAPATTANGVASDNPARRGGNAVGEYEDREGGGGHGDYDRCPEYRVFYEQDDDERDGCHAALEQIVGRPGR